MRRIMLSAFLLLQKEQAAVTTPQNAVEAFFAAHTQGKIDEMQATYAPAATVTFMQTGGTGTAQVSTTLNVKQYLGWYQGQFASRASMRFVVGQTSVNMQGSLAAVWVPLEVHETMKDGRQVTFRIAASLQMFRENGVWKITAHAWQAVAN